MPANQNVERMVDEYGDGCNLSYNNDSICRI